MMTAFASTETAVEAMRLGACDYLVKPFDVDELKLKVREKLESRQLRQENVLLKRALNEPHAFAGIIGRSSPMLAVFELVESVAATTSTVLDHRRVGHRQGTGRARPALQLAAARSSVRRAQLRRAHRDAARVRAVRPHAAARSPAPMRPRRACIEGAEGGTIFLDEIGETTPMMQVKLLRVLQERKFRRVGGLEEIEADIRVVAATNQDLPKMVAEGRFREDLFYRINVIPVQLPPLRERREDIPLIAEHFLAKYREADGEVRSRRFPARPMARLVSHHWPGNIRELENVIERAVALERTPTILADSLPAQLRGLGAGECSRRGRTMRPRCPSGFDLEQHVQSVERRYLAQALERAGGVQVRAAELLGMSFRSFRYYAKKYNLK